MLDEFKDLPYYELKWPEDKLIKANISKIQTDSLVEEACKVVNSFLVGIYPSKVIGPGKVVESKEAVLFFNSVGDIIKVIKKTRLKANQVNVLCADNSTNRKKLKKVGQTIGDIPAEGDLHKMFTFCTRTSFLGTDFYSTNASTYVFANPDIDSLSIDISMDLPQIIGRQRLKQNPFRYDVTLFYTTLRVINDIKLFEAKVEDKINKTKIGLSLEKKGDSDEREFLLSKIDSSVRADNYKDDYVGIKTDINGNKAATLNTLVHISELRSWEVQQQTFKDGYTLLRSLQDEGYESIDSSLDNDYTKFYTNFNGTRSFETRMKLYCDFVNSFGDGQIKLFSFIPSKYHTYYFELGLERIRSVSYKEKDIKLLIALNNDMGKRIRSRLIGQLKIGDRRSLADLKELFKLIYNDLELKISPKASDINKYFTVKKVKMSDRKTDGYEILSYTIEVPEKVNCSVFDRIYKTDTSATMDINTVLGNIKSGFGGIKESIERIRECNDHEEQGRLKFLLLPVVCWSGTFSKKGREWMREYSSYLALDIDKLSQDKIKDYKEKLKTIPYVKAVFLSPSGSGLKAIVRHNNSDPGNHKELFDRIVKSIGLSDFDLSVSDLARGNYLSYDPDIYINPETEVFEFISNPDWEEIKEERIKKTYRRYGNDLGDNRILGCLDSYWSKDSSQYTVGNRHNSCLKQATKLFRCGISKEQTINYLIGSFETLPDIEIKGVVDYIYNTLEDEKFGIDRSTFKPLTDNEKN